MKILMKLSPITLLFIFEIVESYKILVYNPRRTVSHVNFVGKVADTLQEAGHSVTVLQPVQLNSVKAVGSKLAKIIILDNLHSDNDSLSTLTKFNSDIWSSQKLSYLHSLKNYDTICNLLKENCKKVIGNKTLLDELKKENFDIAFGQNYNPCGFGLFKLLGIKNVVSGLCTGYNEGYNELFGLEQQVSYLPSIVGDNGIPKGIIERIRNIFATAYSKYGVIRTFNTKDQEAFDEVFGSGKYDLIELMKEAAFHFVNSIPLLNFPYPTTLKIIEVGDINMIESKTVSEEYDKILSLRQKNVIMSFGSVVKSKTIPSEVRTSILKTFEKFPDTTFIWKYEDDDIAFAKDYPNVVLKKWIPQVDLLNDGRVNLFITHGGLNSVNELAYNGVPSIVIPFLSDQKRNSFMIKRYNCSIAVEKEVLRNAEEFSTYIGEMLSNDKYYKNAQKLSRMIKAYPHDGKNQLIKAVKFAAEFGNIKEMNLPSMEMNFIGLYNLDIYLIFLLTIVLSLYSILKVITCIKKKGPVKKAVKKD
uniref:glucuronosyltransferase n=1 Tax=Strongyloides papillosus TaxID=174720 RepID=A0A0N5CHU3_STREA